MIKKIKNWLDMELDRKGHLETIIIIVAVVCLAVTVLIQALLVDTTRKQEQLRLEAEMSAQLPPVTLEVNLVEEHENPNVLTMATEEPEMVIEPIIEEEIPVEEIPEEVPEQSEIRYYVGEGLMEDGSPVMVPEEPTEYLPVDQYWTTKMYEVHELADAARAIGTPEDSPIILECQRIWHEEKAKLDMTAKMLTNECSISPWQQILDTACCLKHRTERPNWPNTVYECLVQPGQYLPSYANGRYANNLPRCYAAAVIVWDGLYDIPHNVVYQANFPQGAGTWRKAITDTPNFYSKTYFCYDVEWG